MLQLLLLQHAAAVALTDLLHGQCRHRWSATLAQHLLLRLRLGLLLQHLLLLMLLLMLTPRSLLVTRQQQTAALHRSTLHNTALQ